MFENHTKRGLKKLDLMVTLPMVAINRMADGKIGFLSFKFFNFSINRQAVVRLV